MLFSRFIGSLLWLSREVIVKKSVDESIDESSSYVG